MRIIVDIIKNDFKGEQKETAEIWEFDIQDGKRLNLFRLDKRSTIISLDMEPLLELIKDRVTGPDKQGD